MEPSLHAVSCPRCHFETVTSITRERVTLSCRVCRTEITTAQFPKNTSRPTDSDNTPPALPDSGEAVCRFFPELKAEKICEECGGFLSEKAAVTWYGLTYCLPCLHALRNRKDTDSFASKTRIYDNLALSLVTWGLPLSLFTTPVALYYLIRYRKASRGIVPRSSARWWIALIIASLLALFWLTLMTIWIISLFTDLT